MYSCFIKNTNQNPKALSKLKKDIEFKINEENGSFVK